MRISNLLRYTLDNMSKNIKKMCIVIGLQILVMVLIGTIFVEYEKRKCVRDRVNNILTVPAYKCESIKFGDAQISEEDNISFVKEIYSLEGLVAVGNGGGYGGSGVDRRFFEGRLFDIQSKGPDEDKIGGGDIRVRRVDESLWPIFNFKYQDRMDFVHSSDMYTVNLVVGAAYKELGVGTESIITYNGGISVRFVISGILEQGQECITTDIMSQQEIEVENCDYKIFYINPTSADHNDHMYNTDYVMYYVDEEHTVNQIRGEILRIAAKYGISEEDIMFYNGKKAMDMFNKPVDYIIGAIKDIAVLVTVLSVIISICVQSVSIMDSARMYGIMYSNGASRMDVACMLVIENVIKLLLAALSAYAIAMWYYHMAFDASVTFAMELEVLNSKVVYQVLGVGALMTIISTSVALVIINRNTPAKLIRGIM